MLKFTEEELLSTKDIREELVARVEVLDKVKGLLLLPALEMATTQQVADFYEVGAVSIRKVLQRHKDELLLDGLTSMSGKEFRRALGSDIMSHPEYTDNISHISVVIAGQETKISNAKNILFPKRAILRVGMLLRDSEVAKEVRTQLLNIEEKTPDVVKSYNLDKEKQLALEILFGESDTIRLKAFAEYNDNKNKIIAEQKPKVDEFNKLISGNIFLTSTEIASLYVRKNGTKLEAKDINKILLEEGYLEKLGRNVIVTSEKGDLLDCRVKKFKNGYSLVAYVEWTLEAVRELDKVFKKHNLIAKNEKEPVLY